MRIPIDWSYGAIIGAVIGPFMVKRRKYHKLSWTWYNRLMPPPIERRYDFKVSSPWFLNYGKTVQPQWYNMFAKRFLGRLFLQTSRNRSWLWQEGHMKRLRKKIIFKRAWGWARWGGIYSTGTCIFGTLWGEEGFLRIINSLLGASLLGFRKGWRKRPNAGYRKARKMGAFIFLIELVLTEVEHIMIELSRYNREGGTKYTPIGEYKKPETDPILAELQEIERKRAELAARDGSVSGNSFQ